MPKSSTAVKIYEQQNAIEKNWHLERYFVTKEYAQKLRSFFVGPGDIIVSCAGTIGELYVLPPDAQEGLINQALMRIRVKSSLDKNWFIYAFMRMIDEFSAKFSNGSAIKNIPPFADLKNYELFLPNILEQQRIARMLLAIDHRISVQNKIIEDLERLRKFINDAFFESLKTTAIFRTLYKIASEGGTPDTNLKEYYEPAEIPFIKIEDLYSKYLIQNSNYISVLGIEHSSAWLVPKGSILLSNGATIGECTITTYPLCTKQGILGIVPSDSTDSEFIYYLFKSTTFKKQLQRITTKGTMDAAYLKDIDRIQIPFCDKTRQEQHVKTLVPLERKIVLEQSLLQNLISLKRFLLANMFI